MYTNDGWIGQTTLINQSNSNITVSPDIPVSCLIESKGKNHIALPSKDLSLTGDYGQDYYYIDPNGKIVLTPTNTSSVQTLAMKFTEITTPKHHDKKSKTTKTIFQDDQSHANSVAARPYVPFYYPHIKTADFEIGISTSVLTINRNNVHGEIRPQCIYNGYPVIHKNALLLQPGSQWAIRTETTGHSYHPSAENTQKEGWYFVDFGYLH
jgi:hypothetical protein